MKLPRSLLTALVIAGALFFGWRIFQKPPANNSKEFSNQESAVPENSSPIATVATTALSDPNTAAAAAASSELSPATKAQVQVLNEILTSKNDNDPRMDRDLKVLNKETKEAFKAHYKNLAAEKRNDRGTIIFLIGRNIDSKEDLNFLGEVINEPPCKSLSDCNKAESASLNRDHEDHQTGMAVTLAYPQLVTIHTLKNYLKKTPEGPLANQAKDILAQAKHSNIPEVSKAAEDN
ncbi:MAG: hypothetical protein ACKOX6_05220 [Bdellovibrio sp.]